MKNYYTTLFSFRFTIDDLDSSEFAIWPMVETQRELAGYRLIPKSQAGIFLVIGEQIGTEKATAKPAIPISSTVWFDFVFRLKNQALINELPLFDVPQETFPGRGPKIYVSNLDSTNQIDDSETNLTEENAVSEHELVAVVPNKFGFYLPDPAIESVNIQSVEPEDKVNTLIDTTTNKSVKFDVPSYLYEITMDPPSTPKVKVFADTDVLTSNALGIIRIYKDENTNYNSTIPYVINFSTT